MNSKTFFPKYLHVLILFLSAVVFSMALGMSMIDDGLRHIAFSANSDIMKSWADVYPSSLFTEYDPWYLWHVFLEYLLKIISYDFIHIFINIFTIFTLMYLVYEFINREVNYNFASLTYIIVFSITLITSYRYTIIRPDALSGLFIMLALLLKNRFLPIFILTIIYGPFYYLFFLYTGSLGLVAMVQKKWKSFFGLFTASLIVGIYFLIQDSQGYLYTVINILTDQSLRMGLEVGEGKPLFSILKNLNYFVLLILFLGGSASIIYWKYEYFKSNSLATFLLITSILWINQYRYYHLFMPLIYIYMFSVLVNIDKKKFLKIIRKYFVIIKRYSSYAKNVKLFYIIAIPYSIVMFAFVFNTHSTKEHVEEGKFFKGDYFSNKIVLQNYMNTDKYKAVYHNPTVKFVPSCSVGWFDNSDPKMKDIYIRMQKEEGISEEELYSLIKYVKADIYIHYFNNKKQVLNFDKLKNFGIIPNVIYHNRIIFEIKK